MELSEEQLEWRARTLVNLEDRYRAMCTNAELKRIFAHQVALVNTMRNLLKQDKTLKRKAMETVKLALKSRQVHHSRAQFKKLGDFCGTTSQGRTPRAMSRTSTSYVCTRREFSNNQLQSSKKAQTPYDRRCVAHLFIQNGQLDAPHYVKALGVYRKYEDKNRVHLVAQARWLVPADGLEFVDKHWTVIEPSPAEPEHSCIVRTYYLLEVKSPGMGFTHQQESTRNLVMRAITEKSRQILQLMQNTFLDQVVESSMLSS
ncbi:hypothetical protein AM587_10004650 [Phytophthora nicotianae]|uniref:Uncharacterized protein n=1 Tax=Phytophthora nicotianae TaxID=4792 RepID=A0A0W8DMC8_PHYNI|nr:hypothetical protein AM587_10004650 [Phytophthora nicotianae]